MMSGHETRPSRPAAPVAEALGAAIARLLDDREAARRLGAAARRRVASEFTLEREVSGYLRVYRPVGLGGSTLPAPPRID